MPSPRTARDPSRTNVAIIGMGTVGAGVARLLIDHGDRTARHAGKTIWLSKAVVRDLNKPRGIDLPAGILTDSIDEVIDDPEIDVIVQLIGGLSPAREVMLRAMEAGKDIVTANKALLAEHGGELFTRAQQLGRSIAFEAAVAGGVPIVSNISQCLSANQVLSMEGILNGTSNFIVSQMEEKHAGYEPTVKLAQELGYAEADPAMDVDGTDAAQKLAILSHLAFGATVDWRDIPRDGIDRLDPVDLQYAAQLGYRIKLLASARLIDGELELSVAPTLVRKGTPMAEVRDAYNAIRVVGDAVGPVFYHGLGAGQMPTASAVVADLIDTAVGRTQLTFQTLEYFAEGRPARTVQRDVGKLRGRYYLRLHVSNHPGTLATIAGVLAEHEMSIASVIQHEERRGASEATGSSGSEAFVPLVIMTHEASEGAASEATQRIAALPSVEGRAVRMPVRE
ncbi:homoserine dehydrogenase [Allorhodopirellula solitaria]|uniref:Homoserine dehydrogenase n=1 Tax=Allorhodopirellula solitaria TaxID=2527987 RepID=A0A5C5XXN5_9BACT|nr:homoserine dehydrogenase [Allorhodopirellula solitaria]TWT67319.1 Homoserine dehydrogenase [Allorhodopirellula solitaria]